MLELIKVGLQAGDFRLDNISFRVKKGEYLILTGPNGVGKSLLIQSICGLLPIVTGHIRIDNRDVTDLPPRQRRIGYVPQGSQLFPHLTVAKNITFSLDIAAYAPDAIRHRCLELAEPLQLVPLLERSTIHLSGGERQRVALARALASKPELLILDEPLSEIDEDAREQVCHDLRKLQLQTGITLVHISHNSSQIDRLADRVLLLRNGKIE